MPLFKCLNPELNLDMACVRCINQLIIVISVERNRYLLAIDCIYDNV